MKKTLLMTVVMAIVGTSALLYAAGASREGQVLYLKLNDGAGPVARDRSGHNHNGQIHNCKWIKVKTGTLLEFTGHDSFVNVPEIKGIDGSDELTVEAWVYWKGSGRYLNLITAGEWGLRGFLICVEGDRCQFRVGVTNSSSGGSWKETQVEITKVTTGRWHHVAVTFKKPEIKVFLDGKQTGSGSWELPVGYQGPILIGKLPAGGQESTVSGDAHRGLIKEVKLYNRVLTPTEILTSYRSVAGRK